MWQQQQQHNKVYLENFQNGLEVLAGVSFQKPLADFLRVWRAFTPLNTFASPKRTITGLKWILQRAAFHWTTTTTSNWLNEAGSLCSSDSVDEENEIEEQSGRPIQRQIPQSHRGKAKTALVENKLTTASFPDRFFIHTVTVARQIVIEK